MSSRNSHLFQAEGAQALQDHIEAFAFHWIKGWRRHTSVPSELAVFHTLTTAALVRAAEQWNYLRNALRGLPVEILEHCWSFLDTPDLVRAAGVCKAWKKAIHNTPALWTDITFYGSALCSYQQLLVLLGLSKERLIHVSISTGAVTSFEHERISDALRAHAHRLYQLELHDGLAEPPAENWRRPTIHFFEFDAPELRSFTCKKSNVQMVFRGFGALCPKLQVLAVTNLMRTWSPLVNVTSLEFQQDWQNHGFDWLYQGFPHLVRLKVSCGDPRIHLQLPEGSIPDTLQQVILHGFDVSYEDLSDFGLTAVRELDVHGKTLDDTLVLFGRLGAIPRRAEIRGTRHTILADGPAASGQPARTFRISFPISGPGYDTRILDLESVREKIKSLAILPGGLWHEEEKRFILPPHEFPALQTLELVLPAPSGEPPSHALLDLEVMPRSGCLRAPVLRRLAISRWTDDCAIDCRCQLEPIHPLAIVVFIARHMELAPGRQIEEIALDGENGIQLCEMDEYNDSLQILQSHVGTISYRYEGVGSAMA